MARAGARYGGRMPAAATWTWRFENADGAELTAPASDVFGSRADAESWIGENWPAVAAEGVHQAQLLGGGTPVGRVLELA
jgi:hypothetical protein